MPPTQLAKLFAAYLLLLVTSCAGVLSPQEVKSTASLQVAVEQDGSLLSQFTPVFILEDAEKSYNRIGTPAIRITNDGGPEAYIDSLQPTIYAEQQNFVSNGANYRNLIYRIHFEKTPANHLTASYIVRFMICRTRNI